MQTHQQKEDDLLCHLCGEYQSSIKFRSHVLRCYAKTIRINQNYNPSIKTKDLLSLLSQKKITTKEYNSLALKSYVKDSVFKCKKCEQLILKSKMDKHKKQCTKKLKKQKKPSIEDLFKEQIKKIFNSEQNVEEPQPKKKKIKTEKQVKKVKKQEGTKATIEKNKRNNKVQKQFEQKKISNISNFAKTAKKNNISSKRFSNKLPASNTLNEQRKKLKLKKQQTTLEKKPSLKQLMKKFTEIKKENPLNLSRTSRPQSKNKRPKSQLNSPQLKKIFTLKENQKSRENDQSNYIEKTPRKSKWMSKPREKKQPNENLKQMYSATKSMVHDEASFFTIFQKANQQQVENQSQRANKWMRKKITLTHMNSFDRFDNQRNKSAPSDKFKKLRDRNKQQKFNKEEKFKMTSSQVDLVKQDIEDIANYGPVDYYGQASYEVFQQILHPCQFCSRTFLPQRLQKHQRVCQFNNTPQSRLHFFQKVLIFQSKLVENKQQMNLNNEPLYHPKDDKKLKLFKQQIAQLKEGEPIQQQQNLFEDQKMISLFQQPLDKIFLPIEANLSEVFKNHNLYELTYENFKIDQALMQFIAEAAQELHISVLTVFYIFDEIVTQNPILQNSLQNFSSPQNLQLREQVKHMIYIMFWERRKFYLIVLKDMLHVFYQIRNDQSMSQVGPFVEQLNEHDKLFLSIVENLKASIINHQLTQIDRKYIEKFMELKMQEVNILEECLQLVLVNTQFSINQQNLFIVFDIFKARKFQSALRQLIQLTEMKNIYDNINIKESNKQSILNQQIILLLIILRNFNGDKEYDEEFYNSLDNCNKNFAKYIDQQLVQDKSELVLPIIILKLLNDQLVYDNDIQQIKFKNQQNRSNQELLNFMNQNYDNIQANYLDQCIDSLIINMQRQRNGQESVQRFVIKQILELLWRIYKRDSTIFQNILDIEDTAKFFFKLLKEVVQDDLLYYDCFIKNTKKTQIEDSQQIKKKNLESFVDYYLASFPQENDEGFLLCLLLQILLKKQQKKAYFDILARIYQLKYVSLQDINVQLNCVAAKNKDFEQFQDVQCKKLKSDYDIQGFQIKKDTTFYIFKDGINVFQVDYNFIEFMFEKLLSHIQAPFMTDSQFSSLFEVFCKIVSSQNQFTNVEYFDDDISFMKILSILTIVLFGQVNFQAENSYVIFKSLKTLRILLFGKYSKIVKSFLLMTLQDNGPDSKNKLIGFYEQTLDLLQQQDLSHSLEIRYIHKIQRELVQIFQIFIADDNLFIHQYNLNQSILQQENNNDNIYSNVFDYVNKLQNKDFGENKDIFFKDFYYLLERLKNLNYPIYTNLIEQFFQYFLTPLLEIQDYQTHSIWKNKYNFILYQIKAETVELLCIFFKKFQYFESKKVLTYQSQDMLADQVFLQKLINYSLGIDIFQVIRKALEIRIEKDPFQQRQKTKEILLIRNKHLLEVIQQNQNVTCTKFIINYLDNTLQLFSIILDIGRMFIENNIDLEFNLKDKLIENFCFHEKFFSYQFGNTKVRYQVNIIIVLISLLNENEINQNILLDDSGKIYRLGVKIYKEISTKVDCVLQLLNNISFSSIIGGHNYSQRWKKSDSIQGSIFNVLTSIIQFWEAESSISIHSLQEYICGQYNKLPLSYSYEEFFKIKIIDNINQCREEVIDFLIACQKSQFQIIRSLFSINQKSDAKNLTIVEIFIYILKVIKSQQNEDYDCFSNEKTFKLKVLYFLLNTFNEKRFSRDQQDQIKKRLFDLFQDIFFEIFNQGEERSDIICTIISQFSLQIEAQDQYLNFDSLGIINFILLDFFKQLDIQISQIGIEFIKFFKKSFYLQIQNRHNHLFSTKNTYFYQNLCQNLDKLIQYTSNTVVNTNNQNFVKEINSNIDQYIKNLNQTINNRQYYNSYNNYLDNMQYAFQNKYRDSETLSKLKYEYNPHKIYFFLKTYQKNELECLKLMLNCQIYNQLTEIQINKMEFQQQLVELYQIIFSIGFSGYPLSCNLNTLPVHGSSVYALQSLNNLKNHNKISKKQSKIAVDEIATYIQKSNIDLKEIQKYGDQKNKQIFQIHNFENILMYQNIKNKFHLNLVHIYHKNYFDNLDDITIQIVRENLLYTLNNTYQIINDGVSKERTTLSKQINVLKFQNFHLKALNYLQLNLFNLQEKQDNSGFINIIEHILLILLSYKSDMKEIFDRNYKKNQYFFQAIFHCLNYLCQIQYEYKHSLIQEFYQFFQAFVSLTSKAEIDNKKMILLLNCLTLVTRIVPQMVKTEHLDQLAGLLHKNKLNFEVFVLIIEYFTYLLSLNDCQEKVLESNIYRSIVTMNCVIQDYDYESCDFYNGKMIKPIHAKFLKLLIFINKSCRIFLTNKSFIAKVIQFFENYHLRILKIIGFFESKVNENKLYNNEEMPEYYRTTAALDELQQIMILISYLSVSISEWKKQSSELVNKVAQIIMKRTMRLFAKTFLQNKKNISTLIGTNILSDKIIPKTTIEILMQKIALYESSLDNQVYNNNLNNSNIRSTNPLQSVQRNEQTETLITSLFSLKTDCSIINIMFYLSQCLFQFISEPQIFTKLSSGFEDESELQNFHMQFSQIIVDCQGFICSMMIRLFRHQQTFFEASLKLRYLYGTIEAYQEMLGTNNCQQIIILTQLEEQLRRTYEINVFLHISYLENMKEQQSTLYEFNIHQYNNNLRQTKDILLRYQSLTTFSEQLQSGSTSRRSISNSKLRASLRRTLTSPISDFLQRDSQTDEAIEKKKELIKHQMDMEFITKILH